MTDMLEFLLSHDVTLHCYETDRYMSADEAHRLGGEFVVYSLHPTHPTVKELYRGTDFERATEVLEKLLYV